MCRLAPRNWLLLLALALCPLLAQADPLNNGALGVLIIIPLVLLGLFGAMLGLTFWSFLRPESRALYWVQLLLLSIGLWLGLLQAQFVPTNLPLLGTSNPLLEVGVPLGVWLNAVTWARRARRESTGLLALSVAVLALDTLLMAGPSMLLNRLYQQQQAPSDWLLAGYRFLAFGVDVASWWVVLRQVVSRSVLREGLTQPWWRAPAVAAAVGLGYFVAQMSLLFGRHGGLQIVTEWTQLARSGLVGVVLTWAAGVVGHFLSRPGQAAAAPATAPAERQP